MFYILFSYILNNTDVFSNVTVQLCSEGGLCYLEYPPHIRFHENGPLNKRNPVLSMDITAFLGVAPCSPVDMHRRFGETCIHNEGTCIMKNVIECLSETFTHIYETVRRHTQKTVILIFSAVRNRGLILLLAKTKKNWKNCKL
jgi:hypothetical protein